MRTMREATRTDTLVVVEQLNGEKVVKNTRATIQEKSECNAYSLVDPEVVASALA